jgi:hypothetical protein
MSERLSGKDAVLAYVKSLSSITFSSGDGSSRQKRRKRGDVGESVEDGDGGDAVLIGSRALSLYSDISICVPTPAYARDWAPPQPQSAQRDFDVVASVSRIVAAIEAASDAGSLVEVTANVELRRVVVVVRVADGSVVLLDVEPIVSRAAYSTKLADVPSSGAMIAAYARSHALKRCSVPFFGDVPAADVPLLFAITRSHIHFAIAWRHHIETLHAMLASDARLAWDLDASEPLGCLCKLRREELVALRGEPGAHIALGVTNEQFFADSGESALAHERKFDHDRIHEHVAYEPNVPIYTRLRRDPKKALLSEALFLQLDARSQVRLVKEEAMAIALERYLLKGLVQPEEYYEAYCARAHLDHARARLVSRVCMQKLSALQAVRPRSGGRRSAHQQRSSLSGDAGDAVGRSVELGARDTDEPRASVARRLPTRAGECDR